MNYYHVAYFIQDKDVPTLSGLTIEAVSISDAEKEFHWQMDYGFPGAPRSNQIYHQIKLINHEKRKK